MKIAYKPEKINLKLSPKLFAAGQKSMAIVDHNNIVIPVLIRSTRRTDSCNLSRKEICRRSPLGSPRFLEAHTSETIKSWGSEESTPNVMRLCCDSYSLNIQMRQLEGTKIMKVVYILLIRKDLHRTFLFAQITDEDG